MFEWHYETGFFPWQIHKIKSDRQECCVSQRGRSWRKARRNAERYKYWQTRGVNATGKCEWNGAWESVQMKWETKTTGVERARVRHKTEESAMSASCNSRNLFAMRKDCSKWMAKTWKMNARVMHKTNNFQIEETRHINTHTHRGRETKGMSLSFALDLI